MYMYTYSNLLSQQCTKWSFKSFLFKRMVLAGSVFRKRMTLPTVIEDKSELSAVKHFDSRRTFLEK